MYIDFHCHTTASDGRLTPTQLIRKAKKLDFSYIAKCDHDNVDKTDEFLKAGKKYNINAIAGIEISSRYQNKSLHIIGLGIDHHNKHIKKYSANRIAARKKRGQKIIYKLRQNGWHIKQSELNRKLIARPHLALAVINHPKNKQRLIKEFGKIPDFSMFISAYIARGKPGFVPKTFYLKAAAAVKLIKKAGGLAIIGHPASKTKEFSYTKKHLESLLNNIQFDGIEVYSHDHNLNDIQYFKKIVQKYDLLASAGSDYHGYDNLYPLGICNNGKYVTEKMCQPLIKRLTSSAKFFL